MTPAPDPTKCQGDPDCTAQPRMAIKTQRMPNREIKSTVFYNDEGAPPTASRYCKACGAKVMAELIRCLTDFDRPGAR